jgi:hypothetical protein
MSSVTSTIGQYYTLPPKSVLQPVAFIERAYGFAKGQMQFCNWLQNLVYWNRPPLVEGYFNTALVSRISSY